MSYKKSITKSMLFVFVFFVFLSSSIIPILGNNTNENDLSVSTEFDKVYRGFLFKSETLEGFFDTDTYHFYLKEDKEYYFFIKINYDDGTVFGVGLSNGGLVHSDIGIWDDTDPLSERKIVFLYTPDTSQEYTLDFTKAIFEDEDTDYTIYVNRSGFAGYWWMILVGIAALAIIILIIALIVRATKPKKRKRRK